MFERFTDTARHVVVQAQHDARRLGHNYIGREHLLLAAAAAADPASAVLRDQGVTPERVEAEILRTVGRGQTADPLGGLDRQALAFMAIRLAALRPRCRGCIAELAQLGGKCDLNPLGIRYRKLVFEREHLLCPRGKSLRLAERRQFRNQLVLKVFGGVRRQVWWFGPFRTSSLFGSL